MVLFIADLCLVGLSLGRSPLEETLVSDDGGGNPRLSKGVNAASVARIEVVMLLLCIRDMWYAFTSMVGCCIAISAGGFATAVSVQKDSKKGVYLHFSACALRRAI